MALQTPGGDPRVYGFDSRNRKPNTPTNGGGNSTPGLPSRGGTAGASPVSGGQAPGMGSGALVSGSSPYGAGGPSVGGQGGTGAAYSGLPQSDALAWSGGNTYPGQNNPWGSMSGVQATGSYVLPDIYRQPFLDGVSAAGTTASYAGAALPGAAQFQQGLYSENLNPFETNMLNSSAYLGSLGLEQVMNEISGEYALDPYNSGKNKAYYDAANQFGAQMLQTGSQMGLDRMQMATQNLPNVFNFPNQAAQMAQQSAGGLYNAYDHALYDDMRTQYNIWGNWPIQGSTYVQPAAPSGGK